MILWPNLSGTIHFTHNSFYKDAFDVEDKFTSFLMSLRTNICLDIKDSYNFFIDEDSKS